MTGIVQCYKDISNTVTITNDVGGSSELPVGDYRVRLLKSWDDYETGVRCIGELLDPADIETARRSGTTGHRPKDYRKYRMSLYEKVRRAARNFTPRRVYFAGRDFTPDSAGGRVPRAIPNTLPSGVRELVDALLVAENAIRGVQTYETPGSGEYQDHQWVLDTIHSTLNKTYGKAA